ncbi:MAG: endo-1,4-beta-xylanase [Spirochaetales bacterium]|nr:endo-1,4-beta-xylanase [Spirochaetales bacterium]
MKKRYLLIILLILCFAGSLSAQELGDVNNDESVDIIDALLVAQYYVGLDPDPFYLVAADTNCDDMIDIIDALLIAQYYVGLIDELVCEGTPSPTPTETKTETPTPEISNPPTPTSTPAHDENLHPNPGFEDGTTAGWYPFCEGCTLEATTDMPRTGNYSGYISNRNEEWNGPGVDLLPLCEDGETYKVSMWVKLANASSENLKATVKKVDGDGENYEIIATTDVTNSGWTEMSGYFTLEVVGTLEELVYYVEDAPVELTYYVDDAQVIHQSGDWLADANNRIEEIRKRDVVLHVKDSTGTTLNSGSIQVRQLKHHFAFGSALASEANSNATYADFFKNHFEWATFENETKWYSNESSQGNVSYSTADQMYDFCELNGIKVRGHCIFWEVEDYIQDWVKNLSAQQLRAALESRLESVVTHYKGKFPHWDVNNEMLHGTFFIDKLGESIRPWMYQETNRLDPDCMLFVNDYNVVSFGETDLYIAQIRDLLDQGAPIHGIGVQCHFSDEIQPYTVYDRLDKLYHAFNLPVWCTEFDVENSNETVRADLFETFYRIAFSHPGVEGIIMWGFWAGRHWKGEDAAIVNQDWTLNAAGRRYFDLIDEWTTTTSGSISGGQFTFRGFHGEYEVLAGGEVGTFSLKPGSGAATITVNLSADATPVPTAGPTPEPGATTVPTLPPGFIDGEIAVQYLCHEKSTSATQIKPQINIINGTDSGFSLSDLTVRYYYTKEGSAGEEFTIDYAVVGSGNVTGTFHDGYVEIGFTSGAGLLDAKTQTGQIQIRVNKTDWTTYDQSNDYSFDSSYTAFDVYDRITIYHNGTLVWGTVP